MREEISRRKFLERAGIIAVATTLGQVNAENALAKEKPTAETDKEKERPDLIVPSGSVAYDVSDKFFFELQRSGMLIPDDLKRALQEYGLTPNTERAKILLRKIKESK